MSSCLLADSRGASPVVGKAMEATLVVFYIGLVTTALYGGAVPEYRAAAGAEVAERTLANAATSVESAVPPNATAATVHLEVDPPATIVGERYRIRPDGTDLVLETRTLPSRPGRRSSSRAAWSA